MYNHFLNLLLKIFVTMEKTEKMWKEVLYMKHIIRMSLLFGSLLLLQACNINDIEDINKQLSKANITTQDNEQNNNYQSITAMKTDLEAMSDKDLLEHALGKSFDAASFQFPVDISSNEHMRSTVNFLHKDIQLFESEQATILTSVTYNTDKQFLDANAASLYSKEVSLNLSKDMESNEITLQFYLENKGNELVYFNANEAQIAVNSTIKPLTKAMTGNDARGKNFFSTGLHNMTITFVIPKVNQYDSYTITLPPVTNRAGEVLLNASTIKYNKKGEVQS